MCVCVFGLFGLFGSCLDAIAGCCGWCPLASGSSVVCLGEDSLRQDDGAEGVYTKFSSYSNNLLYIVDRASHWKLVRIIKNIHSIDLFARGRV